MCTGELTWRRVWDKGMTRAYPNTADKLKLASLFWKISQSSLFLGNASSSPRPHLALHRSVLPVQCMYLGSQHSSLYFLQSQLGHVCFSSNQTQKRPIRMIYWTKEILTLRAFLFVKNKIKTDHKNTAKNCHIPVTQILQLTFYHIFFIVSFLPISICLSSFFLNHLRVGYRSDAPLSLSTSVHVLYKQGHSPTEP